MTVEQRLETLERKLRRWQRSAVLVVVTTLLVAALGMTESRESPIADVIRSRKFVVVDEKDRAVVILHHRTEGGWIGTFDKSGGRGGRLVEIGATGHGDGMISTYGGNPGKGRMLVDITATDDHRGMIYTYTGGRTRQDFAVKTAELGVN